jgi:homoserine kinase type II
MNSAVWLAADDGWQVVVKSVELSDSAFRPGLELAARLDDSGVRTGRPRASKHGQLVEHVDGRQVALLEFVDGDELGESSTDQDAIGDLLGRVHSAAGLESGDLDDWLHVLTQFDSCLDLEAWIRPAVEKAIAGVQALGEITWAWLHGDPAAEAFRRQPDGQVALIDWGGAMQGPILYDVASAVMYNGSTRVVPAYLARRPHLSGEVNRGLDAFLHLRYAVQAAYFAWRITNNILTGISSPADNVKGLSDARRSFGL